jgi:anti-sigma-K factor RskA
MNLRDNDQLRDQLAGEYVVGTLKGGARRRFEAELLRDAALRALVERWRTRLAPMAEFAAPVEPPDAVWAGIAQRLRLPEEQNNAAPWWRGPSLWRTFALAGSACSVVLAVLLAQRVQQPQIEQVATLTDDKAQAALVVSADRRHHQLLVRVADTVRVPDNRTLQLWAIPKAGHPRSLGVVADNRRATLAFDERMAAGADVVALAISLEPKGGSPNPDGPTGPVLYKGAWVRVM